MWATLLKVQAPACAWCRLATTGGQPPLKVLSHFPAGAGRVWEEVEVTGPGWRERVASWDALPSVHQLTVLSSSHDRGRVRLEVDACPLQHAVAEAGVLPRFPFTVADGVDEWLVVAEREETARFVEELRKRGVVAVVASTREHHPHESLTERQRELMEAAIEQGYYEVPRRVTLTKLAERLHVSKSTLSETLARGERRVLEEMRGEA